MSRPRRLNIFIVGSDGSRPVRLTVPRGVVPAVLIASTLAVAAVGTVVGDYVRVRGLAAGPEILTRQLAAERKLIDTFRSRIGEMQVEVATWRDIEARIWEPFGPDAGPTHKTRGIGGASLAGLVGRPGARPSALEELDTLAETVSEEGQNLRALERLMGRAGKALALLPSRWPVRGAVNSEFGPRLSPWTRTIEFHGGMDIGADRGSPIHAPAPGTVVFAGRQAEFGLTVVIEHPHDIRTLYGHLSRISVRAGEEVERGQMIGLTGNTGKSSGPHLHYEIMVKGQEVNPRVYIWD